MFCTKPPDFSGMTIEALEEYRDRQNAIIKRWKPGGVSLVVAAADVAANTAHFSIPLWVALASGVAIGLVWIEPNFRNLTALAEYRAKNPKPQFG